MFTALISERPALLVRGELSDLLSVDIARRMREAAPSLAFAEIRSVGHAPMLTEPDALAALAAFLDRTP